MIKVAAMPEVLIVTVHVKLVVVRYSKTPFYPEVFRNYE